MAATASDAQARSACDIARTHQRFLLRRLEFAQQYAPMYRNRIEAQHARALRAIHDAVVQRGSVAARRPRQQQQQQQPPRLLRVLELVPGVASMCVGVVYKHMKLLPQFLDEYQRELVRIDAGGDADDDDDDAGGGGGVDEGDGDDGGVVDVAPSVAASPDAATTADAAQDMSMAAVHEHYTLCHTADELTLEDSSGRILLRGLDTSRFCTGVVLGVYGVLLANGSLLVHRYAFSGVDDLRVPRPRLTQHAQRRLQAHEHGDHEPCYVAFVCGLQLGYRSSSAGAGADADAELRRARVMLELLLDFVSGNVVDDALFAQARRIARVVVAGNSIAATDEQLLKKKVRLEPSDHARLGDDGKSTAAAATSTTLHGSGATVAGGGGGSDGGTTVSSAATLMRELDAVLARLCATVEVELMPGDTDLSDAFLPQQPLHPVLLPRAARLSTLRLVTNPYEFVATPRSGGVPQHTKRDDEDEEQDTKNNNNNNKNNNKNNNDKDVGPRGVCFFVSSGQNVNDVARETRFATRLDAMAMMLQSGCACPTAPNTLFSYPFLRDDPFLFRRAPDCLVACDQPRFETRYCSAADLHARTSDFYARDDNDNDNDNDDNDDNNAKTRRQTPARNDDDNNNDDEEAAAHDGVRLVCVPAFHRTGVLVLVDVHSPTLATTAIDFSLLR